MKPEAITMPKRQPKKPTTTDDLGMKPVDYVWSLP